MWSLVVAAASWLALATPAPVQAKNFHCGAGDVACLIAAITEANANGREHHTIRLEAGTYTLRDVDHPTGGNGLPSIMSTLTIQGAGAETTVIERAANAPLFRILQVAAAGSLALKGLTLHGGSAGLLDGGGIFNAGTLALTHTTVDHNGSSDGGGGLFNAGGTVTITHTIFTGNGAVHGGGGLRNQGGTMTIAQTTIARNGSPDGGGGLWIDSGTVTITDSTFVENDGGFVGGGGLLNFSGGVLTITNSTVAHNQAEGRLFGGGGLANNSGTTRIINSTFAENSISFAGSGGIDETRGGTVELQNTILARNTAGPIGHLGPDCSGSVTSLGNNLIGDPTGCTITLQDTDLTGDPGLDTFTDNGTPGNGHFPLLSTSQAIDGGNDAVCPKRDQLRKRRVGPCDIGAIAFRDQDDRHHEEDPLAVDQEAQ
jgi:hypothetical protein